MFDFFFDTLVNFQKIIQSFFFFFKILIHFLDAVVHPYVQNCPYHWNEQTGEISEFNLLCNYRALSIYYLWLKLYHMWFNWHTVCSHMIDRDDVDTHTTPMHTYTNATYGRQIMGKVIILVTCQWDHDSDRNCIECVYCICMRHG